MLSISGVPGRSPVVTPWHGSNRRLGCGVVACALAIALACGFLAGAYVRTATMPAQRHFIHYSCLHPTDTRTRIVCIALLLACRDS